MSELIDRQAAIERAVELPLFGKLVKIVAVSELETLPSAQPEITDEQAIEHLQASGWMQNHDKQMYEMGLKERLADDSDSYDALLPSAQPEQQWIPCSERLPKDVQIGEEYPTVIFCTKEKTYTGFYEYYLGGRWWTADGDSVVDGVIAWRELPEPYAERREE